MSILGFETRGLIIFESKWHNVSGIEYFELDNFLKITGSIFEKNYGRNVDTVSKTAPENNSFLISFAPLYFNATRNPGRRNYHSQNQKLDGHVVACSTSILAFTDTFQSAMIFSQSWHVKPRKIVMDTALLHTLLHALRIFFSVFNEENDYCSSSWS